MNALTFASSVPLNPIKQFRNIKNHDVFKTISNLNVMIARRKKRCNAEDARTNSLDETYVFMARIECENPNRMVNTQISSLVFAAVLACRHDDDYRKSYYSPSATCS